MPRELIDHPPSAVPTERDLIRAGALFDELGADYLQNRNRFALIVVARADSGVPQFFQTYFGGTIYKHGTSQRRWQITGERMRDFIQTIHPYLYSDGRAIIEETMFLDAHLQRRQARLLDKQSHVLSETGLPLPGVREPGMELALPTPPPLIPSDSVSLVLEPPGSSEAQGDISTLQNWLSSPSSEAIYICKAPDGISKWKELLERPTPDGLVGLASISINGEHLIVTKT